MDVYYCIISKHRIKNKYTFSIILKYNTKFGLPKNKHKMKITKDENPNSIYTTPEIHSYTSKVINKLEELFDIKNIYYNFYEVRKYKVRIDCIFTRDDMFKLITLCKVLGLI